jgi:hypothetical protein
MVQCMCSRQCERGVLSASDGSEPELAGAGSRLSSQEAGTLLSFENVPAYIRNSLLFRKSSGSDISDTPSGGLYLHSYECGRECANQGRECIGREPQHWRQINRRIAGQQMWNSVRVQEMNWYVR